MSIIFYAVLTLGIIGLLAAIMLYIAAQKFKVVEDPRIDQVEEILPGANCGNCGYPGCRGFAEACCKADSLDKLVCTVGGSPTMEKVADCLGLVAEKTDPMIAVVRCNGTCENRPQTSEYDGIQSCSVINALYGGSTDCKYGCLGCGDCVDACQFDAIHMDPKTGLPVVDQDKCVACGACVKACPRDIIELRKKGPKDKRVFVSCVSNDKGGVAKKACTAACIGCGLCVKACPFDAITLVNNLAYIDYNKCKLCRKCVVVCPTHAIHDVNFATPAVAAKPKLDAAKTGNVTVAKPATPAAPKKEAIPASDVKPKTEASEAPVETKKN